jgi:branched-chain amino acid transport system substrate-binding protein
MHQLNRHAASRRAIYAIAALGCLSLIVFIAGCGGSSGGGSGGSSSSGPIKVGNISTLSGIPLPYGEEGAKAYFNALNKKGGIDGRKIEYIVADDKENPSVASQLARKLVQQEGIVAFAGGISLVDCSVNGKFYDQEGVPDVMAGASDPTCFENEMIAPVNVGPLAGITAGMLFLEEQNAAPTCGIYNNIPTLNDAYGGAGEKYEEISGNSIPFESHAASANANFTTLMLQVKNAGCKGLNAPVSGPEVPALVKAAQQVGWDGTILFGGASYVAETPKALGSSGEGVYAISEMYPFTSESKILDPVKADFETAGVELTGLSEAGWLSAKILANTLEGIKGEITRESVKEALQELTTYDTEGLTDKPYAFGPGTEHNPNQSIWPVVIKGGEWDPSATHWVSVPQQ